MVTAAEPGHIMFLAARAAPIYALVQTQILHDMGPCNKNRPWNREWDRDVAVPDGAMIRRAKQNG